MSQRSGKKKISKTFLIAILLVLAAFLAWNTIKNSTDSSSVASPEEAGQQTVGNVADGETTGTTDGSTAGAVSGDGQYVNWLDKVLTEHGGLIFVLWCGVLAIAYVIQRTRAPL